METWFDYWTFSQHLAIFIGVIVSSYALVSIARSLRHIVHMLRRQEQTRE